MGLKILILLPFDLKLFLLNLFSHLFLYEFPSTKFALVAISFYLVACTSFLLKRWNRGGMTMAAVRAGALSATMFPSMLKKNILNIVVIIYEIQGNKNKKLEACLWTVLKDISLTVRYPPGFNKFFLKSRGQHTNNLETREH